MKKEYIPGVCNIGEVEIKQRKAIGWIGFVITAICVFYIYRYNLPLKTKWLIFFPAFIGATGLIQCYSHFCAGFGMKGLFNFSDKLGKTDTASQAIFRAKDRRKAIAIFRQSFLTALIIAILVAVYL